MNTITASRADNGVIATLTPDEFAAKFLPRLIERDAKTPRPDDYYIRNAETGKIEIHVTKPVYARYSAEEKQHIWSLFRWSRNDACWISRGLPNEGHAELIDAAEMLGLTDGSIYALSMSDNAKSAAKAVTKPKAENNTASIAKRPEIIPAAKPKSVGSISADEIEHALHRGSGFAGGKIRIAAFYAGNHTPDEAKQFLRQEYGTGGCSHVFLDGSHGFVDYGGKGIEIRRGWDKDATVMQLSWVAVHAYLHAMVLEGRYLTDKEQAELNSISKQHHGKLPAPNPCMHYPPEKKARNKTHERRNHHEHQHHTRHNARGLFHPQPRNRQAGTALRQGHLRGLERSG